MPVKYIQDSDLPKEIMLHHEESFYDKDGVKYTYPAHKPIKQQHSIRILVDRKAHWYEKEVLSE